MILDLGCQIVSEEPAEDPEKPAVPVFERVRRQRAAKPGGDNRKPRGKNPHKSAKSGKSAGGAKSGRSSGRSSGASKSKEADPNSPFAVLAALKK